MAILRGFFLFILISSAHAAPFLVGANAVDWQCDDERCVYGTELGRNGWIDIHLTMHGYSGAPQFRKDVWNKIFKDLESIHANFIRIPLMTEGQGILWHPWRAGQIDKIAGADPVWIENVSWLLDEAHKHKIQVQLGLLTGNTPPDAKGKYNFYYGKILILRDPQTRMDYLQKVIVPLLKRVGSHPALIHLDLLGEANGALIEGPRGVVTSQDLSLLVSASIKTARTHAPKVKLTASFGYTPDAGDVGRLFGNTELDFYQIHHYSTGALGPCASWRALNKPVMLGEFGVDRAIEGDGDGSRSRYRQSQVTKAYLHNAMECGFMGAAIWAMNPRAHGSELANYQNLYDSRGEVKPELGELIKLRRWFSDQVLGR